MKKKYIITTPEKFSARMRNLKYPKIPQKPLLNYSIDAEYYVNNLKKYEIHYSDFIKAKKKYSDESNKIYQEFKIWAIEDCGLNNLPNKKEVFSYAWMKGHSSGFYEVYSILEELSELFLIYLPKQQK